MGHTRGHHVGESRICGDTPRSSYDRTESSNRTRKEKSIIQVKSRRSSHSVKRDDDSAPIVRAVRAHYGSRPHGSPRMPILAANQGASSDWCMAWVEFVNLVNSPGVGRAGFASMWTMPRATSRVETPISSDSAGNCDCNTRSMLL